MHTGTSQQKKDSGVHTCLLLMCRVGAIKLGDAGGCHRAMVPCAKRGSANDAIAGYALVSLPATQNNTHSSHLHGTVRFLYDGTDRFGSRTRPLSLNYPLLS